MADVGMKEEHRKLLQKHRVTLVKDLEPLRILNLLGEILDNDDRDDVKVCLTRSEKAEKLLDLLPRKGPKAFERFVRTLMTKQKHLGDLLLEESGLQLAEEPSHHHGMSEDHRRILKENASLLRSMNLDKILPLLSFCLDEEERGQISEMESTSEKVDKLLLDVLPRKGPTAFESFVRVLEQIQPEFANPLMKDAGMKPWQPGGSGTNDRASTNSEFELRYPIQHNETLSASTLLQEVVQNYPEAMTNFHNSMDKEDLFGHGWRTLYKELNLPQGKENAIESQDGSPTWLVITSWCQISAHEATVQKLLDATKKAGRGDCYLQLEKDLGLHLDDVDRGVENVTSKMAGLGCRVVSDSTIPQFLGDLEPQKRLNIATKIDAGLERDGGSGAFIAELQKKLGCEGKGSARELLLHGENLRIRELSRLLKSNNQKDVVEEMRKILPEGTTGPLLYESMNVRDIPYGVRRRLTMELCDGDRWKFLAEHLNVDPSQVRYLDSREKNPADEVLRHWEVKSNSTVKRLYDILLKLEYHHIADIM